MTDARQYAPATERNQEPILKVLLRVLPRRGDILEISSGTGQHALYFAPYVYPRRWIPSDCNDPALESIKAWANYCLTDNLQPPLYINAEEGKWSVENQETNIAAIVNINMIHIAPWSACEGLMAGAGRILPNDGVLYLYGPYKINGRHTSDSNEIFHNSLLVQSHLWGLRDLEEVVAQAKKEGLHQTETIPMPAHNFSLVFKKVA
ncbi:MAG: hypothetical protein N5P05_000851 [Chroococcopsis gigantea SAG 12.99]|jgi:SAM-dependent methyltransferase|nr:DUF938 domain-containing protein [Chlorogloea purpurea SAG 13.99]MDV2999245.1 hypothetical protein [Chroococcopsis gigantea SAG 12.99]